MNIYKVYSIYGPLEEYFSNRKYAIDYIEKFTTSSEMRISVISIHTDDIIMEMRDTTSFARSLRDNIKPEALREVVRQLMADGMRIDF